MVGSFLQSLGGYENDAYGALTLASELTDRLIHDQPLGIQTIKNKKRNLQLARVHVEISTLLGKDRNGEIKRDKKEKDEEQKDKLCRAVLSLLRLGNWDRGYEFAT